ncbi:hypothetical protein Y032_0371g125 [Ancylostoma ceylanicum]|uniref:SCP domain-containing protein n=1 Tax=Ancylostoma ceylanicum TaxID=53326 RepID=A0A016RU98_9BILA|nr:hypothetical protein Y032_0371g125 [Ancylostoma ceylanicum]
MAGLAVFCVIAFILLAKVVVHGQGGPAGTTGAAGGTTAAAGGTTGAAGGTTGAAGGTTGAAAGTTGAAGGTTGAAGGTTGAAGGTTGAAGGTTGAAGGTTGAAGGTTAAPGGTTAAPGGTTAAPGGTTAAPGGTTAAPTRPPWPKPNCGNPRLTNSLRNLFLNMHNNWRGSVARGQTETSMGWGIAPPATLMYRMKYTCNAESYAQQYIQSCNTNGLPEYTHPGYKVNTHVLRTLQTSNAGAAQNAMSTWWSQLARFGMRSNMMFYATGTTSTNTSTKWVQFAPDAEEANVMVKLFAVGENRGTTKTSRDEI